MHVCVFWLSTVHQCSETSQSKTQRDLHVKQSVQAAAVSSIYLIHGSSVTNVCQGILQTVWQIEYNSGKHTNIKLNDFDETQE